MGLPVGDPVKLGPDTPLHAGELRRALRTRVIGRRLQVHDEVSSTQLRAREAAASGAGPGLVVLAESQSEGRGRMGRRWLAPPGACLLVSLVVSPPEELPAAALTITSAVAVAEALAGSCGVETRIRWPNDVLVEGRKVAGILVEAMGLPSGERGLIIGVGVNVNASPPEVPGAGALAELVTPPGPVDRTVLLVSMLEVLDHWYEVLMRGRTEEVELHWRARSSILGEQVTLERAGERYRGRVVDLSVTEGIILELAPGVSRLFASEHVALIGEP